MKQSAFTLIEVSAAIVLLAACTVCFAQLVALTTSERTSERTRQMAVDQLQNVLERLVTTETEQLISGDFDKTLFESLIKNSLPDGRITFESKTIDNATAMGTIAVSWNDGAKRPRRKIVMFRLLYTPSILPAGSTEE